MREIRTSGSEGGAGRKPRSYLYLELRLCQPRAAASADFKTVGLTRRGPPTCRHRREEEIEPRITRTDAKVR
jgi:hypothetical protein